MKSRKYYSFDVWGFDGNVMFEDFGIVMETLVL